MSESGTLLTAAKAAVKYEMISLIVHKEQGYK